jgi:hypothetical protein
MFVEIPPKISVGDFMRRVKGQHLNESSTGVSHLKEKILGQKIF